MYITIYVKNKPLYLCDELDVRLEKLHHQPDTVFIDELDSHTIKSMLRELDLPQIKAGIFLHEDLEKLKKAFLKKFELHIAGGGLVINEKKELLMIFRRGYWDLPKGHLDKGEIIEACALREVREETGLQRVELLHPLTITYHSYEQGTHHILKESHWFLMRAHSAEALTGQSEEGIDEVLWVPEDNTERYLQKAYPSIKDVLSTYLKQSL